MDSVKEEVWSLVAEACTQMRAAPFAERGVIDETTDAIMSALKRVPGVVVSDGFADLIGILDRHVDAEHYTAADALEDLTKARSIAKRITSAVEPTETPDPLTQAGEGQPEATQGAVEPSCVVTDEMVEAAWSAFVGAGEDWRDGAVRRRDDLDKAALKAALTAALSSRTEEEVRASVIEDLKAGLRTERLKDVVWTTVDVSNFLDRARSLTNGGE